MNLLHSLVPLTEDSQAVSHQPQEKFSLLDIQEILFKTDYNPQEAYPRLKKCTSALMKTLRRKKLKEDPNSSSCC